MQNGLDQKAQNARGDEFDSTYIQHSNMNQAYGMAPTTDSYMPSYYGQMAFPYMGGSEWSTGTDSMPYLSQYGGDAQQAGFIPDAVFNHPPNQLGSTPAYYNQPYNFFPTGSDFSAWATPSAPHGTGIPETSGGTGFGQPSAASAPYNGDYYQSLMPATPHDYLGGGEGLQSGTNNMVGHGAPGPVIPNTSGVVPAHDSISKMPVGTSSSIKIVEQGIQSMVLGMHGEPVKQQIVQQTVSMPMPGGITPNAVMAAQVGQAASANNASSPVMSRSNAPKPVSWAAIASKPAKPQPKPKVKSVVGSGLPPPIKHNMDIGTWDNSQPPPPKGPARGPMPGQPLTMPQRWSAPRQSGLVQGNVPEINQGNQNQQHPMVANHQNDAASKSQDLDESVNRVLEKLKAENDYNPKRLTLDVRNARFFVIKSYSEDDIHRSIKYNIWCSTEHGNKRLDAAYRAQQGRGPVIFLYSVNGSGHFCGVAEMTSNIDYSKRAGVWSQDKWKGKFQVRWIYAKDVPNNMLRHIRLENNENKPVTNSRDTQEVPAEKGRQVLKIISNYKHTTSIFDDFAHYERREQEEELLRAKRTDHNKSRESNKRGDKSSKHEQSQQQQEQL